MAKGWSTCFITDSRSWSCSLSCWQPFGSPKPATQVSRAVPSLAVGEKRRRVARSPHRERGATSFDGHRERRSRSCNRSRRTTACSTSSTRMNSRRSSGCRGERPAGLERQAHRDDQVRTDVKFHNGRRSRPRTWSRPNQDSSSPPGVLCRAPARTRRRHDHGIDPSTVVSR